MFYFRRWEKPVSECFHLNNEGGGGGVEIRFCCKFEQFCCSSSFTFLPWLSTFSQSTHKVAGSLTYAKFDNFPLELCVCCPVRCSVQLSCRLLNAPVPSFTSWKYFLSALLDSKVYIGCAIGLVQTGKKTHARHSPEAKYNCMDYKKTNHIMQ